MILSVIILDGELSKQQYATVMEIIEYGGKRLHCWADTVKNIFPTYNHDIPLASTMDIGKLGSGGAITSGNCNSAQK